MKCKVMTAMLAIILISVSLAHAGWGKFFGGVGFGIAANSFFKPCYHQPCHRPVVMVQTTPQIYTSYVAYPQPTCCCMQCNIHYSHETREQELNAKIYETETELKRLQWKKRKLNQRF